MNDKQNEKDGMEAFFSNSMDVAGNFWENMFKVWHNAANTHNSQDSSIKSKTGKGTSGKGETEKGKNRRKHTSLDTMMKSFQALASAISKPEAMASYSKGAGVMPEILVKMALANIEGFIQIQHKWLERAGKVGKSTEAYTFEDLDENAFKAWAEIYEKEIKQFFNIPQIGLTRLYQEKMNRVMDKFSVFQTTFGEFMQVLNRPVVKSLSVMQEELGEMAEAGKLPEDSKTYYQMWIKILEGHYMKLFQSPEYVTSMGQTLNSLSEFSVAKNEAMEDMLNSLPIPTQREIDILYKELYLLKKRIKLLEKRSNRK